MAINKVFLVGNVCADCKEYGKEETNCITWTVAVDDRRYNKEIEEWDNIPGFFYCAMFGKRAAALASSIKKGARLAIEGHLRYSNYEDEEGKKSRISIVADNIEFMTAKEPAKKRASKKAANDDVPFDV